MDYLNTFLFRSVKIDHLYFIRRIRDFFLNFRMPLAYIGLILLVMVNCSFLALCLRVQTTVMQRTHTIQIENVISLVYIKLKRTIGCSTMNYRQTIQKFNCHETNQLIATFEMCEKLHLIEEECNFR